ncbi:MAG: acylneuraminate cytidylyltransferase [Acidobacteria bacterium]|nr:acylneuraminate cytidylyltransferase [Acidobacteriota bacterium]
MTVGAIVQARMGSTRLPGKALLDIAGMSMLARVVDRTGRARTIDRVIVATTTKAQDDPLVEHALELPVDVYRGDEEDVLDRYYQTATYHKLDVIVRITSDCPLLDPGLADDVVRPLLDAASRVDYSANTLRRTFPRGLDVEAVPFATLERVWREATSVHDRAHVFPYIYEHPDKFSMTGVADTIDRSEMRWTVDTEEDLMFVRKVCLALGAREFTWCDVLALLERQPELLRINKMVREKSAREL